MLQHFSIRRLQHDLAIFKLSWGECAEGLALPFIFAAVHDGFRQKVQRRMKQSRWMSMVESIVNVVVGYGVAVVTQILIFPAFSLNATLEQNLQMGAVFTLLCGAPHNAVYAEWMIMRSNLGPTTAKN
ncbi:MAG: hypothetical protein Q8N17_16240 [Burkholderiaceae bacterium]|nr:hypothetical protein [Burkholderiaceae bacterium]